MDLKNYIIACEICLQRLIPLSEKELRLYNKIKSHPDLSEWSEADDFELLDQACKSIKKKLEPYKTHQLQKYFRKEGESLLPVKRFLLFTPSFWAVVIFVLAFSAMIVGMGVLIEGKNLVGELEKNNLLNRPISTLPIDFNFDKVKSLLTSKADANSATNSVILTGREYDAFKDLQEAKNDNIRDAAVELRAAVNNKNPNSDENIIILTSEEVEILKLVGNYQWHDLVRDHARQNTSQYASTLAEKELEDWNANLLVALYSISPPKMLCNDNKNSTEKEPEKKPEEVSRKNEAFVSQWEALRNINVMSQLTLPLIFGIIGSLAFHLRSIQIQRKNIGMVVSDGWASFLAALCLGAFAGVVSGWMNFPINHESYMPFVVAFGVGYGLDLFFKNIDGLVSGLTVHLDK